jgi:integrase
LGWLRLAESEGGAGLPESQVHTLAWLAVPDYLERFLDWKKQRIKARSKGAIQFLATIASLVRPDTGYLRQSPELAATLPERYSTMDWNTLCDETFVHTQDLVAAYSDEIAVGRDSFAPIMHILQLPQPMDAVADMVQRMRLDRPVGDHLGEAIWSRDLVLIRILSSNPLRRRNLAHLTWRADNTGEIHQRVDGSWWIKLHKSRFKNVRGAAGDREYYEAQVNPSAWPDIQKYVKTYRPRLLRAPSDLFFVTSPKGPVKAAKAVPWVDLSKRVSELTHRYLYRCPGVGCHAFRHIVATSILKASGGDFRTAALVLYDRVATVEKHYAFLTANEGNSRMEELLQESFSRM